MFHIKTYLNKVKQRINKKNAERQEEIDKISHSIRNKKISQGTVTAEFEEKFAEMLNVPFAIAVPSGTIALNLALMASGIKAGDEVLVPGLTVTPSLKTLLSPIINSEGSPAYFKSWGIVPMEEKG